MSKFLKGNYPIKKSKKLRFGKQKKLIEEFERRALEKLGGSIAFVSKSEMLWVGDEEIK